MSRPRKSTLEKCQPCSFSLPPDIIDALNKHENKSMVVALILEQNLELLGELSILEIENIRRRRVTNIVNEELVHAIERIRRRVVDEGWSDQSWFETLKADLRKDTIYNKEDDTNE